MRRDCLVICCLCVLAFSAFSQPVPQERLDFLMAEIRSDDKQRCLKAAIELSEYGPRAKAAIPDLLNSIRNEKFNIYVMLISLRISTEEPVERILQLADDEALSVQSLVIPCLRCSALPPDEIIKGYIALLDRDNPPLVTLEVIQELNTLGSAKPYLDRVLQLAKNEDEQVQAFAVSLLGEIGIANDRVKQVLIDAFSHPDKRERAEIACMYQNLFPKESQGLELLEALAKDEDGHIRWHVARAIGKLNELNSRSIQLLNELAEDDDGQVRAWTCYAKICHDLEKETSWKTIVNLLESKDASQRLYAIFIVSELGPKAHGRQDRILEMLDDENDLIQREAISALTEIQPTKEIVLPILEKRLKSAKDVITWNLLDGTIRDIKRMDDTSLNNEY